MNTLSAAFRDIDSSSDTLFRVVQDATLEHMLNGRGFSQNVLMRLQDFNLPPDAVANDSAVISRMVLEGYYSTDLTVSVFGRIEPAPYMPKR